MIRVWLTVRPRDDGLLENSRFPPFPEWRWMLLYRGKRTNGARGRILRLGLIGIFGIAVVFHKVAPVGGMDGDGAFVMTNLSDLPITFHYSN
ncbi:hypothetical protein [Sphingobium yanoikuyae]|uniref:hypothetical protein n=1 Tax=Sphingobium yanoikuyae TaxID=13690 RepID=UPI00345E24FB